MSDQTPLMRQYNDLKKKYPGSILFFRMGDFYEMFGEDAIIASKILQITLTTRGKNSDGNIPLCGVPHHAADNYIAKLIKAGMKVAVCEQLEDPRQAKGIVKRDVVRLMTAGTLVEENLLSASDNNFLLALMPTPRKTGMAFVDISTGEFYISESEDRDYARMLNNIDSLDPKEILIPKGGATKEPASAVLKKYKTRVNLTEDWNFNYETARERLLEQFGVRSLEGFGVEGMDAGIAAAGAIFLYLNETQSNCMGTITQVRAYHPGKYMVMDESTRKNLELVESPSGKEGTLLHCIDETITAMGARKIKSWLLHPMLDLVEITERHQAVGEIYDGYYMRDRLRVNLKGIHDMERLVARITTGLSGPRELAALRSTLAAIPIVRATVAETGSTRLNELKALFSDHRELKDALDVSIVDEPPVSLKDGGVIRPGFCEELDTLRSYCTEGKSLIAKIEADERMKSGIDSLKVRYNKVFGYYIEITRSNLARVPDYFIRKQTLVNAERYITPELKEYEEKVLGAEEKILELESRLFGELRAEVARYAAALQQTASAVAELDALASLAEVATLREYCRPDIDDGGVIEIEEGRHPVIEEITGREKFIPNDTTLDPFGSRMVIITGPNMAGKSTYMRQVALIVLLAQIGSFVPARSARLGAVDRIFTRVGASDNIARGQSTFMVEMNETANILNNATGRSLIILDEIGRGTSTFDGLSIAWAVAEYINDRTKIGAKTLFATHYHELTALADHMEGVKNCNIAVREWRDEIVFLRKIIDGGTDKSYGIQVARLAGLPKAVIERAKQILARLERSKYDESIGVSPPKDMSAALQMDLFTSGPKEFVLADELAALDTMNMTPIQALTKLSELSEKAVRLKDGGES